jgi:hypothetical protein
VADGDFLELVTAIKTKWFATSGTTMYYGDMGGTVIAYNRADALPRPERAAISYTPGSWQAGVPGPRQLSICASFYSDRNLKRQRGRIYLPLSGLMSIPNEKPSSANLDRVNALMVAINDAAVALSPSWSHTVHSTVDNVDRVVTNYWCNDVWDIQRRRAQRESARHTATP